MASMAMKMVSAFFEAQDVKPDIVRDDLMAVGWNLKNGSVRLFLHFDEEDSLAHFEGVEFIKVPEEKYDAIYKVLNEVNDDYKFVKFVLDTENGSLCARDDALIQLDSCGEECFEIMIRMIQIIDDAYPKFMKALWS